MKQRPIQRQRPMRLFPWKMRWYEIDVENISNEVGSVKNVSSWFLLFLSTPVFLRSSAGRLLSRFLLLSVFTFTRSARPIRFIVPVLPTRHLFGPC